jgi:hypothetical protein
MPKNLNFQLRLARLQEELEACDTPILENLHHAAIDQTHAAARTYFELRDAANDESIRYEQWFNEYGQQLSAEIAAIRLETQSLQNQLTINPEVTTDSQTLSKKILLMRRISTVKIRSLTLTMAQQRHAIKSNELEQLVSVLFDQILGPERDKFSVEVVKSALGFGIGMVPIWGTIVDALTRILDLMDRHRTRAENADAHIQYLSDYYAALGLWIENAEKRAQFLQAAYTEF